VISKDTNILWIGKKAASPEESTNGSGSSSHGKWNAELLDNSTKIYDNATNLLKAAEPTSHTGVDSASAGY